MNLINGETVNEKDCRVFLGKLDGYVAETLDAGYPGAELVIGAADALSRSLTQETVAKWLPEDGGAAVLLLEQARQHLSRGYLERKLELELGSRPFEYRDIGGGRRTAYRPLGVLTHIAAGNAQGLPAFSVLEGLLTGNINLLKLPGHDDGLSTELLRRLIEIEPRLKRHVCVFDLPSTDAEAIRSLLNVSDAAVVWGSDFAVSGIRALAPPQLQLIEWGHRLSFCCVTRRGETPEALAGIARDICETEQLVCSAPQCVYYEADTFDDLIAFGARLAEALDDAAAVVPPHMPDMHTRAEITELCRRSSCEELLEQKKVLKGSGYAVIVCGDPALAATPGFRTVWVKPMSGGAFDSALRQRHGWLQTAGVACLRDELQGLSERLYRCGVCRVMPCGSMTSNVSGEPHDGQYALRRYVKAVTCAL